MNAKSINEGVEIEDIMSNKEKMTLTVELWQIVEGKDGKDYINIQMKNTEGEHVNARQYLNKKDNGDYKGFIYPGNDEITSSISYEMLELAKAYDSVGYAKLRIQYPKSCRTLFEKLKFELEVKRVQNQKGEEFLIPLFAYAKKKDEEYQKAEKDNSTQVEKNVFEEAKKENNPYDLPFG